MQSYIYYKNIAISMTQTNITRTNKKTNSLRTVIPPIVKETLHLKHGDRINWKPEITENNKIFFVIEKVTGDKENMED